MPSQNTEHDVIQHYQHGSLLQTILDAFRDSGRDPDRLTADDLATVDEFHTGGREATIEFADRLGFPMGATLLDVGSGLGGPARYFAGHRGCSVSGVDLSEEFCGTATELSARTGLKEKTSYQQGSVAALPFTERSFDGAYMLHVGMNLPDKQTVFGEVARVLKPGGVFGVYDIMREGAGDLQFPLPWATTAEMSFVETMPAYAEALKESGFEIEKQRSLREFAVAFFAKMRAAAQAGPAPGAPPNLALIMGPARLAKLQNLAVSIQQGLLAPWEIVARRQK